GARAADRTGERGESLPRSGKEGAPRGGRSGRSPEDRESARGNPPEGETAASPEDRECRRFRAGAARPNGEAGRRDSLVDSIDLEEHVRRALGEVLGVVSLFAGDQPLGLLFAPGFHLDGPRLSDDLRDGHTISRHGPAL